MANNTTVSHAISNDVLLCSLVFKFIAMIVGVLGNLTVIIHTIFLNKEKTTTSYLTGNLALTDLLVCLTFYPIWIIEFIEILLNIDSDQDLFCKFSRSTMWAFMFASIVTLLAITVDRYLYIVKPLKYPQIVRHRRVFLAVSGIWLTTGCFFCFLTYLLQELSWHWVAKFLLLTGQYYLFCKSFFYISSSYHIFAQLPHFIRCSKTT